MYKKVWKLMVCPSYTQIQNTLTLLNFFKYIKHLNSFHINLFLFLWRNLNINLFLWFSYLLIFLYFIRLIFLPYRDYIYFWTYLWVVDLLIKFHLLMAIIIQSPELFRKNRVISWGRVWKRVSITLKPLLPISKKNSSVYFYVLFCFHWENGCLVHYILGITIITNRAFFCNPAVA